MRIRRNAKISPLLYAATSLNPGIIAQPHVCQLNQSPWDVMSFSPPSSPPYQGNGNCSYAGNGSSRDSIAVREREAEESSNNAVKWEDFGGAATTEDEQPSDDPNNPTGTIILCCKTDGKSWKCRRQAAKGNSLCDHHLSMVRSYSSSAHSTAKNSSRPAAEGRRRPRVKKPAAPSLSNPYMFYYYSGFGPRWGKKRGEDGANSNAGDTSDNLDRRHYMEPSNLSETDEEFEYEEEDDDDQDEYQNGKKRTRKRVKARSLKSL
ncbi:uncharacterized protein [Henckelia pumila]|uniref:uncharacterized protein n=1 Tax=Henckelia pumila TaxID=405737 RepID=UPI003C6DDCCE